MMQTGDGEVKSASFRLTKRAVPVRPFFVALNNSLNLGRLTPSVRPS